MSRGNEYLRSLKKNQDLSKNIPRGWSTITSAGQHGPIMSFEHPKEGIVSIHQNPETKQFEVKHNGAYAGLRGNKGIYGDKNAALGHAQNYLHALSQGTVAGKRMLNSSSAAPNSVAGNPQPTLNKDDPNPSASSAPVGDPSSPRIDPDRAKQFVEGFNHPTTLGQGWQNIKQAFGMGKAQKYFASLKKSIDDKVVSPKKDAFNLYKEILDTSGQLVGGTVREGSMYVPENGSNGASSGYKEGTERFHYMGLVWDIDGIREDFGKYAENATVRCTSDWSKGINIDRKAAMKSESDKPVIIATLPLDVGQRHLLIDGHHRMYKACANGKETLPAHILSPEDTLKYMETYPDLMSKLWANVKTDAPIRKSEIIAVNPEELYKAISKYKTPVRGKKARGTEEHHTIPVAENVDWHLRNLWEKPGQPGGWRTTQEVPSTEHRALHAKKSPNSYLRSLKKKVNPPALVRKDEPAVEAAPAQVDYLSQYLKTAQNRLDRALATNDDVVGEINNKYSGAEKKKRIAAHERMLKYWKEAVDVAKRAMNGRQAGEAPRIRISEKNSKLKKDGIVSFNLPAGHACPGKGDCFGLCYAMVGPQSWPDAISARAENWASADRPDFADRMTEELKAFPPGQKVRVHDSGDFYNQDYIDKWHKIAQANPDKHFYAYTKALNLDWRKLAQLPNFNIIQSVGGAYDNLIDPSLPHAFIFPSADEMHSNGYIDTSHSDLPATDKKNTKIGLVIHGLRAAQLNPDKFGQRFQGDVSISDPTLKPEKKKMAKSEDLKKNSYVPEAAKFDQPDHFNQAAAYADKHPVRKLKLAHVIKLSMLKP